MAKNLSFKVTSKALTFAVSRKGENLETKWIGTSIDLGGGNVLADGNGNIIVLGQSGFSAGYRALP